MKAKKKGCENDSSVHVVRDSNLQVSGTVTALSGHIPVVSGAQVSGNDMVISGVIDVVFGMCTVDSGVGVFISGITVQVEVRKKGYEDNKKPLRKGIRNVP
jgi:hypothetical protein